MHSLRMISRTSPISGKLYVELVKLGVGYRGFINLLLQHFAKSKLSPISLIIGVQ